MSLSDEDKGKIARGEPLPPKWKLTEELLLEVGVGPSKAAAVVKMLGENGIETWEGLKTVETLKEMEDKADDSVSGKILWKRLHPPAQPVTSVWKVHKVLEKVPESADGILGFVAVEVSPAELHLKRPRLGSEEAKQERIVKLGQQLWGDPKRTKSIWLRECYTELYRIVRAKLDCEVGTVLIAGTRGVGKSVFGLLVVMNLVDEGKVVLYDHKKEKMLLLGKAASEADRGILRKCLEDQGYLPIEDGVYRFTAESESLRGILLSKKSFVHVQDFGEFPGVELARHGKGRKIIVTSPNNDQLRAMHSDNDVLKLIMPLWTEDELLSARAQCYADRPDLTDEYVKETFEKYGGVSRFVLEFKKEEMDVGLEDALQSISIAQLAETFRALTIESLSSMKVTGYFVHLLPVPYQGEITTSVENHELDELSRKYRRFRCVPGSDHLQELLADRFVRDEDFLQQQLARAVQSTPQLRGLYGHMLGAHGHRVLTKGGTRKLKMLEGGVVGLDSIRLPLLRSRPPFPGRDGLKDVKGIRCEEYIRPMISNYPTWDSVAVLKNSAFRKDGLVCAMFQFACGTRHKPMNGAVVKETQELILNNLVPAERPSQPDPSTTTTTTKKRSVPSLPPSLRKKSKGETKNVQLEMIMVYATTKDGIQTAQTMLNTDGKEYDSHGGHRPKVAQYSMVMDDTFHRLAQLFEKSVE